MEWDRTTVILLGLCAIVIAAVIYALGPRRRTGGFAYQAAGPLLTRAEYGAFCWLQRAVGTRTCVFAKVRLADLVKVKQAFLSPRDRMRALGYIAQKHVDFVVATRRGDVLFALEVDDRSHCRRDRRERDAFVNEVFEMANLRLVRVRPGRLDESAALRQEIAKLDARKGEG